jgi:hypothetical protein
MFAGCGEELTSRLSQNLFRRRSLLPLGSLGAHTESRFHGLENLPTTEGAYLEQALITTTTTRRKATMFVTISFAWPERVNRDGLGV